LNLERPTLFLLSAERVTRHVGIPVHERAGGAFLPRPDVQRVEGWQSKPVGRLEKMEELSHHLRRTGVLRVPRVSEDEELEGLDQIAHGESAYRP